MFKMVAVTLFHGKKTSLG